MMAMTAETVEARAKRILENRMIGFSSCREDAQSVVDVLVVLTDRDLTTDRAMAILSDAAKVIPLISDY